MKAALATAYGSPKVNSTSVVPTPIPKRNELLILIHGSVVNAMDRYRGEGRTQRSCLLLLAGMHNARLRIPRFLLGATVMLSTLLCSSQHGQRMSVAVYNQSTAIPFTRFFTVPVHPGLQVAAEFDLNDRPHGRAFTAAHLGYFFHKHLAHGFYIGGDLGYEVRTRFGLSFAGMVGVGYMRTYVTQPEYIFQNGSYVRRPDKGNGRLMPSLSLETGYYFKPERRSTQLFIRYQSWVEYPYSPGFIELMSHIGLHLGVRFTINP